MLSRFGKTAGVFLLVSLFLTVGWFLRRTTRDPVRLRQRQTRWTGVICRGVLRVLRVRASVTGHAFPTQGLIVANHLSYVDALVLYALGPVVFVTSQEVRDSGLLGAITYCAGCLFIERRSRNFLRDEIARITAILSQGFTVVLFPEGTTGSGESVLPFKKSFLMAAVDAGVPVQPLCLNYRRANGKPVSAEFRDHLFYYGDMEFFPHFTRLASLDSVEIEVKVFDALACGPEQDRKFLADTAYQLIDQSYVKILQ